MGQAAKRKKQRQQINLKQESGTCKPEIQLPSNLDERHRTVVEALWSIPVVAEILDKIKRLPAVDYLLASDAEALFHTFEKFAASCYQLETNPMLKKAWADAPTIALENAMSLHIINCLAVGDVVPQVIERKSVEHGIEIAHYNLTSGEWRIPPLGNLVERI